MAPITTLQTDNPTVALIVAAHNEAEQLVPMPSTHDLAAYDQREALYCQRFARIYAALAAATATSAAGAASPTGGTTQTPAAP